MSNYKIIVYKRPGFEVTETHGGNVTILNAPLLEISSTFIRKQIRESKSIHYLVPEKVFQYIADNGYYKN